MARKGITPIIAVVLLLVMTVSAGGLAFMFLTNTQSDVQGRTQASVDALQTAASCLQILSVQHSYLLLRNCGSAGIANTSFSVYVDDIQVIHQTQEAIGPQESVKVYFSGHYLGPHTIRVKSANGVSASQGWDGGFAYAYDGSNDMIQVPDHPSLMMTTAVTLSMWVKVSAQDQSWEEFWKKGADGLETGTDATQRGIWTNGHYVTNVWNLSQWVHITYVSTSSPAATRLYVNGVQFGGSWANTNLPMDAGPTAFGVSAPAQTFNGQLDEIRIYNRSLTDSEILANAYGDYPTNGLVSYWNFDKANGCTVPDVVGTNHGTLQPGCPTDVPTLVWQ